jgi:hypothetical protein
VIHEKAVLHGLKAYTGRGSSWGHVRLCTKNKGKTLLGFRLYEQVLKAWGVNAKKPDLPALVLVYGLTLLWFYPACEDFSVAGYLSDDLRRQIEALQAGLKPARPKGGKRSTIRFRPRTSGAVTVRRYQLLPEGSPGETLVVERAQVWSAVIHATREIRSNGLTVLYLNPPRGRAQPNVPYRLFFDDCRNIIFRREPERRPVVFGFEARRLQPTY